MSKLKYFLIAGLLRIAGLLPLKLAQAIGRFVGLLAWRLNGRSRKTTDVNLRICLPELSAEEQQRLSKESMAHTGMTAMEIPLMWEWPVDKCFKLIKETRGWSWLIRRWPLARGG